MKNKFIYILLLFVCGTHVAFPQQHNFRRYSIEEDLPRAGVYEVFEDSRGYIWIGTEGGGVCRFDGTTFLTYTTQDGLCSNAIRSIYEDSYGNLWFGSDGNGISRFDGEHFITLTKKDGLSSNIIRAICEDNHKNIWLGTEGGGINKFSIWALHPERKKVIEPQQITEITKKTGLPSNMVRVIKKDRDGFLWIGADGGIAVHANGRFIKYGKKEGLPHRIILDIFEDNKGNIWVGTEKGAAKFDGESFKTFTMADGIIHYRVKSITQDQQGTMWFGTLQGLSNFDGKKFESFAANEGLSNIRIRSVFCDSFGNIWIATYFGGIMKYSGKLFTTFTDRDSLPNNQITAAALDARNTVWLGTWEGVASIDPQKGKPSPEEEINDKIGAQLINSIFTDYFNRIWIANSEKLFVFENNAQKRLLKTFELSNAQSIIMADSSNMWVGTTNGLYNLTFSDFHDLNAPFSKTSYSEEDGLSGRRVSSLAFDHKKNLWIGFSDAGITVYSGSHYITLPSFREINGVSSIIYKDKEMWVGTQNSGIYGYKFNRDDKIIDPPVHITKKNGLYSEQISLMKFDKKEKLWIGTKNGVSQLELNDTLTSIKHFGYQEGFSGVETMDNAVTMDSAGNMWFGTIRGAIRLSHEADLTDSIQSRTHLINLKLSFKDVNWREMPFAQGKQKWVNLPQKLELPYNQRSLTFEFRGLSYRHPEKVKYRWKLEGYDPDWSPESNVNQATYGNLPAGEYTFKVISSNGDGIWNKKAETFSFIVKKPFWQTFSFYILLIGVIAFIFVVGYQIKVYQLAKAKKSLEIEVAARTLELNQEKELAIKRKSELEEKNIELQKRNQDVTSSLQYAHLIQSAILEKEELLTECFPNSFIVYQPKDIVSGDFYWFRKTKNSLFVAVADGTGHGVPGAFMSIVGNNALEQALKENEHASPNEVLTRLDELIYSTLNSSYTESQQPDGIDMALCKISLHHRMLEYAGAMRPLIIVPKKKKEFKKIPATRNGLGTETPARKFVNHTIITEPGDRVFMFSDGYADQFGGPKGKKFLSKRFYRMLEEGSKLPIQNQHRQVIGELISWTGMEEQVDDILVIGIEV